MFQLSNSNSAPRLRTTPAHPTPPRVPDDIRRVPRAFFDRDTALVARELLGLLLIRRLDERLCVGRIVETEAYLGPQDRASHSSRGLTPRNRSMFGPPGHAYVYRIYGIHHCLNFVTEPEGHGAAVLIRALEPISGITHRTCGPGLLCAALAIDRSLDGSPLDTDTLWIGEPMIRSRMTIVRTPRIGVDYAGPWARRLLRFLVKGNAHVSGPKRIRATSRPFIACP